MRTPHPTDWENKGVLALMQLSEPFEFPTRVGDLGSYTALRSIGVSAITAAAKASAKPT
ncbi:hypothetical protein [Paracoccus aminophilus]|uniref:hypothetical protein n=1 Tax=Paracoccus aminophilus TaxID=34003 RepID=UPI00130D88BB|nr:hypothetical protein [Paracoccus aminophilus]